MKLNNSNYSFVSEEPIFTHNGKTYNAHQLTDEQIGELIVDKCTVFKKEKQPTGANPAALPAGQ